jgi:lipid II:glycine glycyltransferase (peptidoglycan interpeptide bridge formation enzyme)
MASEVRNRIRRAEREGVSVRIERDAEGFFPIYRDVFERQSLSLSIDDRSFARFIEQIVALDVGRLYAARMPDGRLCAACLMVFDRRRAYYSLAASHADLRKNGAPSLLVWEALRDLFETYEELDFGGANVPHVAQFKSKFRGRRLEYPEATVFRSNIERFAIGSLRELRRRLVK